MGRWSEMKEPELLEDYAARLRQGREYRPVVLSGGGQKLRIGQPLAGRRGPFTQLPQRPEAGEAGSGYYTYGTDETDRPGTKANGQYGRSKTMQVISSVAGQLANSDKETVFGVGNISLRDGRYFPPHDGHRDGLGIDVRPPRIDKKQQRVDYRDPEYDRAATQRLLRAFLATGQVATIYFNDPDIGIEEVKPLPGHNDHFHVQLKD